MYKIKFTTTWTSCLKSYQIFYFSDEGGRNGEPSSLGLRSIAQGAATLSIMYTVGTLLPGQTEPTSWVESRHKRVYSIVCTLLKSHGKLPLT